MTKIKIENFGPIKLGYQENDGWLEIKKNTFFTGNQGSGKSTLAKLISTLLWLEKSINRGDTDKNKLSRAKFKDLTRYHKIHNYFIDNNTYIEYLGEKYHIIYAKNSSEPLKIKKIENSSYIVPKIMYIPAERNFLSTIRDAYNVKGLQDNIFDFAEELRRAQKALNGKRLELEIGNYKYEYDEDEDKSYVIGDDYRLNLLEASSGLQSFTPLYLVTRNLSMSISHEENRLRKNLSVDQSLRMDNEIAELILNDKIPDIVKTEEIELIRARYYNKCFFNIVEEPEQNLFPSSQWEMLKCLLKFNNRNDGSKLLITTHSPYIINNLAIAIKAFGLYKKCGTKKAKQGITDIISFESTIKPKDLAIYEFSESNGSIQKLIDYNGIPSDENFLNNKLGEANNNFINLLEIEDQCQ